MKRLVFHVISIRDTLDFKAVYENLTDTKIIINPIKNDVIRELTNNPTCDVIFIGHGDSKGLYDKDLKEYCMDYETVPLLKDRFLIGLWCFAAEFADFYKLHGFFTSDFISNEKEFYIHFPGGDIVDSYLTILNQTFANRIHYLIEQDIDPRNWVEDLQKKINLSSSVVDKYNYEALTYYEKYVQ